MSSPESISSRMHRLGSKSAICKISLRFFSPPEKPTLTPRRSMSCGMFSRVATSRTFLRKSGVENSLSPRALRWAFSAVRRNVMVATPGISTGYWNARNTPFAERSSGDISKRPSPLNRISPPVTSSPGLPAMTWLSVDLPEPFGPMMACTSPRFTVSERPWRISRSSTPTCRFLTSSNGITFFRFFSSRGAPKAALSNRTFEADRDQLLRFHREFHRQLLQHVLDKAVDHEADRLFLAQPALHAIEQDVL